MNTFRLLFFGLWSIRLILADPIRPFPLIDSYLKTTNVLNHSSYLDLANITDQQWYLDNLPFIDVPDNSTRDVYYYRASVVKRHLKFAHEGHGWIFTEFIQPVSWASKLQTIPDSAALHMVEARWLRNPNYVKNLVEQYTRGGVETLSNITYTHWIIRAAVEYAQATGDVPWLTSQLDGFINMYGLWNVVRDNTTGLYFRTPLSDAQEYSLTDYLVGGPGGGPMQEWNDFGLSYGEGGGNDYQILWTGPETYRPSFNGYMVAEAYSIAQVASMAGNTSVATQWMQYGDQLYQKMLDMLYDTDLNFWIDVVQGSNLRAVGRQLIGFYPYRFGLGTNDTFIRGLEAGLTADRFLSDYGPTTLEMTNPYFTSLKNTTYCCQWNGQSWPFSTSLYLDVLAQIARAGLSDIITPDFFIDAMNIYTRTNHKDGIPFVAESHYPLMDMWSADTTNHSEHYLHSTYINNIFADLFGIVPDFGDNFVMMPLTPSNWTYWAIENLPYHGGLLSIFWDADGSHYDGTEAGLSIYSNGTLFHHQSQLGTVNATLPFDSAQAAQTLASQAQWQNIAVNPNAPWNFPNVTSTDDFSAGGDTKPYPPYKLNDGLLWYDLTPDNYWTNNQSQVPMSTVNITLTRPRKIHSVSLAIISTVEYGGVMACPAGIKVQDSKGQVVALRNPWTDCVPNALNTIDFAAPEPNNQDNSSTPDSAYEVETDLLQITLSDALRYGIAMSEVQIWVRPESGPRYEAEDGLIGTFIGSYEGVASGLNGTIENGGVAMGHACWVEIANVRTADGEAAQAALTLVGGGRGTVSVMTNWLPDTRRRVSFDGMGNRTIEADLLWGSNTVTIFQEEGEPFIDAIVIGS